MLGDRGEGRDLRGDNGDDINCSRFWRTVKGRMACWRGSVIDYNIMVAEMTKIDGDSCQHFVCSHG